jgi:hypothetical protein
MRTLVMVALTATLVGCSCPLPQQASLEACPDANGFCFDGTPASQPVEPKPSLFKAHSAIIKVKPTIAAKTEKPPFADTRDGAHLAVKTAKSTVIAAKVEPPTSGQAAETSDPVLIKAKTTIAAKLENPASAEFGEAKRAMRKNLRGESVDSICGRVKGKKASGEDTGDRPFLYLVKDDDAYVVDGPAGSAAATAYRNICKTSLEQ